jgi:hypothetical protein
MTLQGVREFQFQLDLEEGESKLKDSSKELLCQEGRIGTGGIRMVCDFDMFPLLLYTCMVCYLFV